MNRDNAEQALIVSALVVAIVYAYRRLEEATSPGVTLPRLIGLGNPVPFASWVTAWGTTFFMLSIASTFAPGVAGAFSILVAVSDVLANGQQLFADLGKQTSGAVTGATNAATAGARNVGKGAAAGANTSTSGVSAAGTAAAGAVTNG